MATRKRRWQRGGAVLVLLTTAAVAACSAGDARGGATGQEASGSGAQPVTHGALNAAAEVDAQLYDARNRLYDKCMSGKGFTVHPSHQPVDPAQYTINEPPAPVPENEADARRFGYRISEAPQGEPAEKVVRHDPFDDLPPQVRRQYDEALTGPGNP